MVVVGVGVRRRGRGRRDEVRAVGGLSDPDMDRDED